MNVRWVAPLAALLLLACDKKPEAEPASRTAAVIEKAPAAPAPAAEAPPQIKPVAAPEPTPAPEAKRTEPVPTPEPAPTPVPEGKPAEPAPTPEAKPAEPAPTPKPPEPATDDGGGAQALVPDLTVTDAAVTDAIVDRMPSERKTSWKIGEDAKLIGWFEFKNPGAAVDLDLVWKKNGTENWRFPTSVGSGKNWRTWAEKRITKKDAGNWTVDVVDSNGHVYESVSYSVE